MCSLSLQKGNLSYLATGKVFAAPAFPKVATPVEDGTNADAEVDTLAAIARSATVFFIVNMILNSM